MAGGGGKEYKLAVKIAGKLDSSFTAAISQASKSMSALGSTGRTIGSSVKIAAAGFTATAAAVAGVGVASVNTGREFEAAMDSVAATAGATEEQYAALEAAALEMGRTTSKTAAESAAALEYMSLAGWSVDESIQGLPSILRLSEATGLDLATTSDLVTDSMSALGVTVDGLAGYLDIAAKANNKSNQTAQQLMEAYLGVGGTMKNLNIPLEESATALGVLANRGIKGSEAGTALNAIMVNLTTGTGKAGTMMEKLGVSAFDSEGNFIGLEATLQNLNTALQGCTEEERNAALAAIGGKTHVDALNDLMSGLNTTNEEGISEWQQLETELYNANGALETMAATKLDNLNGDMAIFQSALQDAGIKIYKHLQQPLRDLTQFGTEEIYKLSDALQEGGFSGMAQTLGTVMSESLLELSGYASSFLDIVFTISDGLFSGLQANAPALGEAGANLISQLITGFTRYYGQFWTTGGTLLLYFMQGLISQAPTIITTVVQTALQMLNGIAAMAPTFASLGAQLLIQLALGLAQAAPSLIVAGLNAVFSVAQAILSQAPQLVSAGLQLIAGLLQGLLAGAQFLVTSGVEMVLNVANGILAALPALIQQAGAVALSFLQGLVAALPSIIQGGIALVVGLIQGIAANLPSIISTGGQIIGALLSGLLTAAGSLIGQIPAIFGSIIEAIFSIDWLQVGADLISAIWSGIVSAFTGLFDGLKSLWDGVVDFFTGGGEEAAEAVVAGVEAGAPEVTAAAQATTQAATTGFQFDTATLSQYGIDASTNLSTGLLSQTGSVQAAGYANGTSALTGMTNGMNANLPTLATTANGAGTLLTDEMSNGITAGTANLDGIIAGLGTEASTALNTSLIDNLPSIDAAALASGTAITDGITSGIDTGMATTTTTATTSGLETINAMAEGFSSGATTITGTIDSMGSSIDTSMAATLTSVTATNTSAWTQIDADATSSMTNMQTQFQSAAQGMQSQAASTFNAIRSQVTSAINAAASAVQSAVSRMRSAMNFSWSLPHLKVPHVSVSGTFSIDPPSAPRFSVSWYKEGGILDGAQIFGAAGNTLLGGGEAGKEAVLPLTDLWAEMRTVMSDVLTQTGTSGLGALAEQLDALDIGRGETSVADLLAQLDTDGGGTGAEPDGTEGGPVYQITFSPVYHFEGEAPTRDDLVEANRMSQDEFNRMMDKYLRERARTNF